MSEHWESSLASGELKEQQQASYTAIVFRDETSKNSKVRTK